MWFQKKKCWIPQGKIFEVKERSDHVDDVKENTKALSEGSHSKEVGEFRTLGRGTNTSLRE